ncbi:MAG: hypothetical protein Q7V19_00840, partial [Bacteroidales bacterium]|nr:hypothetical protein [Bacteroidales bacterium]
MKKTIQNHQKLRAVSRILENNPQIFADKTDAETARLQLNLLLDKASGLISNLLRPISVVHRLKQEVQKVFEINTNKIIGMGLLLADHIKSSSLRDLLETYKKKMRIVSAYKKFEIANHLLAEVVRHQSIASNYGLTAEKIEEFGQ